MPDEKKDKNIHHAPRTPYSATTRRAALGIGAAVLVFGIAAFFYTRPKPPKEEAPVYVPPAINDSLPQSDAAMPPASSAPASSEAPAPYPMFQLQEADVVALNTMLDEWTQQETMVKKSLLEGDDEPQASSAPGEGDSMPQEELVADGGHAVAVWYLDIASGAQYGYNADEPFWYASLMKAPYAMYLYQLAEQGACDLAADIIVTPGDVSGYEENSGEIKKMTLPATFTTEQLIGYMLRNSDTVALRVLLRQYPADGFWQWAAERGVEGERLGNVVGGYATARQMGILLGGMYEYMLYGAHGVALREHLENGNYAPIQSEWPVAGKYGWDTRAYHDMAVVFAQRPYLVVILTDKWGGSWGEYAMFAKVTKQLEDAAASAWAAFGAGGA